MAKMYPEVYPGRWDIENPEFVVYQELRKLPPEFSIFYSKKFKGVLKAKEEVEIDFLIFNGKDVLICLEVKGGLLKYDGAESRWYQNGKPLERSPDRQVSAATHALIRGMEEVISSVNVDWALCFPHCQIPEPTRELTGLPRVHIIDERKLLDINGAVNLLIAHLRNKWRKPGLTTNQAGALIELLNRSLGFIQKLGIKIAKNNQQLIEVTEEQFVALEDIKLNPRILINGSAGTGKTLLAQEFAKRLDREEKNVLLLFFNKAIARKSAQPLRKGIRFK